MTKYSDYSPEEASARATRDALADYIEQLPPAVYNSDRALWDARLAEEDRIVDALIEKRYQEQEVKYLRDIEAWYGVSWEQMADAVRAAFEQMEIEADQNWLGVTSDPRTPADMELDDMSDNWKAQQMELRGGL